MAARRLTVASIVLRGQRPLRGHRALACVRAGEPRLELSIVLRGQRPLRGHRANACVRAVRVRPLLFDPTTTPWLRLYVSVLYLPDDGGLDVGASCARNIKNIPK